MENIITFNKERKTVQVNNGFPFAPLPYIKAADGRIFKLDWEEEKYVPQEEESIELPSGDVRKL